jgi:hypothetical protein
VERAGPQDVVLRRPWGRDPGTGLAIKEVDIDADSVEWLVNSSR